MTPLFQIRDTLSPRLDFHLCLKKKKKKGQFPLEMVHLLEAMSIRKRQISHQTAPAGTRDNEVQLRRQ